MKILIGDTGLVGSTILKTNKFDYTYNSRNITNFSNHDGDELFLCCLPATKWIVNQNLKQDLDNIFSIIKILSNYFYKSIILISTIDVYCDSPLGVNENYKPNIGKLNYGNNRYLFELLVQEYLKTDNLKIFRLPALFNNLIKKNILYDLLNNNNIKSINLNSSYQWYNLDNLYKDIQLYSAKYPSNNIFNLFTEPVPTKEIVELFPYKKKEYSFGSKLEYDYRTTYGCYNEYISNKNLIIEQIKSLIENFKNV